MKTIKKQFKGDRSRWYVAEQYISSFCSTNSSILDLGYKNQFSDTMKERGYRVQSTNFDLDQYTDLLQSVNEYDIVVAFQVFEHLVNAYGVLTALKAGTRLICSVPLRVWYSKPYWNATDPLKQHYHEFSPREFKVLLTKAGYEVTHWQEEVIVKNFGIRQILTWIFRVPRYLFVVAEKLSYQKILDRREEESIIERDKLINQVRQRFYY